MIQDIRYAIRSLARTPVLTTAALLILSLGIGATTAIFTIANASLFRPLPYRDPERLVQFGTIGVLEFAAYREQSRSFESLVSYQAVNKNLENIGEPERISAIAAERGLFDLLGVRPFLGRTFTPRDSANVAVVSDGFWRRRFGAAPTINDWTIVLDGQPYTVIGIMPASFQFPYRATSTDVWIPMDLPRTDNWFQRIDVAVGRLERGVTIDRAATELDAIARRLEPLTRSNPQYSVPMMSLTEAVVGRTRTGLLTLLGAVAMVLLIACANVAGLLITRADVRKREIAIRVALGASRADLLRQFLTESLLLVSTACVAATAMSIAGTTLLLTIAGAEVPRSSEVGLDWTVLLFLLALGAIIGLAFGLLPALHSTRSDISGLLNARDNRASRARPGVAWGNALVVVEIALAFTLLTGAGLLLRAFLYLEQVPTGVVADRVLTLRLESRGLVQQRTAGSDGTSAQGRYFQTIEDRVMQIPGVRAAGFVTRLHLQSPGNTGRFTIVGQPPPNGEGASVRLREASPRYFRALGIPLRAGRLFTDRDTGIVVNEALVRQHFPGQDPIGRVLDRGTIVGVVGDVRQTLRRPAEPEIYQNLSRTAYSAATLVVNSDMRPEALIAPIRAAIHDVTPRQTVFDVKVMDDVIRSTHGDVDSSLWLIGLFAGLAFILSIAGIYAVSSHAIARRQKEFGIRLALGAGPARVLRLVLAQGGLLIVTGVAIGVASAIVVTRVLQSLLYGVTPTDPITFAASTLFLTAVAFVAVFAPALRAVKLDPMIVLRHE